MKKLLFVFASCLCLLNQNSFSQIFDWGSGSPNMRYGAITDVLGNFYTCGVDGSGGTNWAIEKFSPAGNLLWSVYDGGGGAYASNLNEVVVDANGDLYAAGFLYTGSSIGGVPVAVAGNGDYVVVKYNNQGVLQWYKLVSGPAGDEWISHIQMTSTGDVFIAGTYKNTVTIGGTPLNSGGYHLYWATFDTNGNTLTTTECPSTIATSWNATLDANDNLYFASYYNSTQSVLKMNANGTIAWNYSTGGGNGEFWDIAVDSNGDVYVAGSWDGSMVVNGVTYTSVSMFDDIDVMKVNAGGSFGWFKQFGGLNSDNAYALALDPYGHIFITGMYEGTANFDALSLAPVGGSYEAFFISMDTTGAMRWALNGGANFADIGKNVYYDPYSGHLFFSGISSGPNTFGTLHFANGDYGYVVSVVDSSCTSMGKVFRDMNANGTLDAGEPPFPHRIVELTPGPLYASSGMGGLYELYTNVGSYSMSIPNAPLYYTPAGPTLHTSTFTLLGQIDSLNDFALVPTPNMNDLVITMTPTNYGARSGMMEMYYFTYENVGTTTIANAEVRFGFDNSLGFSAAVPAPTSLIGSDSVIWNVGTLAPGDMGLIAAFVSISGAIGTPLTFYASINPVGGDQTPGNNVQSLGQLVVNSWDPNEKRVMPEGNLTPAEIAAGTDLTYTIRFQNTGNDTAYFVRLVDTLDADLDLSTFEFVAESHHSNWNITNGRVLTIDFEQINLVDSATNEPLSHGFFKYRVTPLTSLTLGTQIINRAHIYFDFNPAIVTNDAVTIVANPVAIDYSSAEPLLNVYPNPASGKVYFSWINETPEVGCSISIVDVQGKTLISESIKPGLTSVSLAGIAAGMYFYRLTDSKGMMMQSGKIVVE